MKVLVLCDDHWHPASTVKGGLAPLEELGYSFEYIEDAMNWSAEEMEKYPVVILSKSNNISSTDTKPWMTDEVQKAFQAYVDNGGSLLAIHSGTADYKETTILRPLLGGVFINHPEQCLVTMEMVPDHHLTEGCDDYTLKDEHYFMALDDKLADIFMRTTSVNGIQPGGWTRNHGKGRVCVITPGHNLEIWLHPSFQRMVQNALKWCTSL